MAKDKEKKEEEVQNYPDAIAKVVMDQDDADAWQGAVEVTNETTSEVGLAEIDKAVIINENIWKHPGGWLQGFSLIITSPSCRGLYIKKNRNFVTNLFNAS